MAKWLKKYQAGGGDKLEWSPNQKAKISTTKPVGVSVGSVNYQEQPYQGISKEQQDKIDELKRTDTPFHKAIREFDANKYTNSPYSPAEGKVLGTVGNILAYPVKALNNIVDPEHSYTGNPYNNMLDYGSDAMAVESMSQGLQKGIRRGISNWIDTYYKDLPTNEPFNSQSITRGPIKSPHPSAPLDPNYKYIPPATGSKAATLTIDPPALPINPGQELDENGYPIISNFVTKNPLSKGELFGANYKKPWFREDDPLSKALGVHDFSDIRTMPFNTPEYGPDFKEIFPNQYTDFGPKTSYQKMFEGRQDIPESLKPTVRQQNKYGGKLKNNWLKQY